MKPGAAQQQRWTEHIWLATLLLAIGLALAGTSALRRWDDLFYDLQLRMWFRPAPADIVIVGIDEESLQALGRWPWPRRIHAEMMKRLTDIGARVVALDIILAEPDTQDPSGDLALAQAIHAHGKVVLPVVPDPTRATAPGALLPLPILAQSATLGHVDVQLDADGIARRVSLEAGLGPLQWPALALAMHDLGTGRTSLEAEGGRRVSRDTRTASQWFRGPPFLVPYFGPPGTFESLSFVKVLRADGAVFERLHDRYVLVGAMAAGLGPALATPVPGQGRPMQGVEFNANVLAALTQGLAITPLGTAGGFALTALLVLLPALVYPRCRAPWVPLAAAVVLLLPMALSWGLLRVAHVWFAPAPALVAVAFSYPLWSWRRLRATVRALTETRGRALATLHSIDDAVLTTDREGRIDYLNPMAEALTGRSLADVRGRALEQVVEAYDENGIRQIDLPLRECLVEGQSPGPSGPVLLRSALGAERVVRWGGSPIRDASGAINGMVLALSDITQMTAANRQMLRLATHDALTDLPNRTLLQDRMEKALARAQRTGRRVGVMFVDLDGFKRVNDALGHGAGDTLLREVALRLKSHSRGEDTVARWGGDEFVVVHEDVRSKDGAAGDARKILGVMSIPFHLGDQEIHLSVSIGISFFPRDGEDVGALLKRADAAMHRAKEKGSNGFQFYSQEMNDWARERLALEKELWAALNGGELQLHYQPQFDVSSGRLAGVEALLRWRHPERGMISPGRFLPVAEQTDLIHALGEWAMRTACTQLASWHSEGLPRLSMAINLSPRQLLKRDLYRSVLGAARSANVDPALLVLEISENLFLKDSNSVGSVLRNLRDLGIRISIDDFGTGYSSIGYLKRLPIDELKIDKSFARNVLNNAGDAAITQGIIALAHGLRLQVIAEGVEDHAQFLFFKEHSCDGVQGYYFSRPRPAAELVDLLRAGTVPSGGHLGASVAPHSIQ